MHGTAHHTTGGLTKKALKYNKWGKIVSVKKSMKAKKDKRLEKMGFKTRKGHFGVVKTKKGKKGKKGGAEEESDSESDSE
jgi:hypothetical protein